MTLDWITISTFKFEQTILSLAIESKMKCLVCNGDVGDVIFRKGEEIVRYGNIPLEKWFFHWRREDDSGRGLESW